MANRVTGYQSGREKDAHGARLYLETKQGIATAAPARTDANEENAARAKRGGPWVAGTQDDQSAGASGTGRRREN